MSRSTTVESKTATKAEPEILVERIQSLLEAQDLLGARREAARAAEVFPNHPWLEKAGRVLNPTRVASIPATGPDRTREFDWLRRNSGKYRGKWVALLADDLIAAADDFDALLRQIRTKQLENKPLVHRID